ncbi:VCBS domain-containing protein [Bradyrhizobium sp. CIAT3101]|uniref:VCBS domain-containing protein n=1 Tax=Bradyrhizobium sp. CIAT3101 TaxID=439387 RepID=UPI0024B154F9|nr:VCBS domain-containing protein [Bradyrhizobium sp. CIAT3101]WFU81907.1 VCBS domain-containing protein [Bradyrhizobium sp. CIAT3101]
MPEGAVVVADPNLIFNGEFKRTGVDLVLSHDGHEFVVHDYFRGDKRAAIASPDGAHLTGDIVSALTGYVQVAQAAPGAAAAQVIGHVTKLTGSATAVRNGVSVILNNGDNVEKGDVVSTGSDSTLGVTFIDGTVFGLSSNARMVLNEMVYDPNGSNNSSLLSLVAGTITFVAGETAKHGDMKIDTPVATMGIRGTAVLTEINFVVPAGGGDPQPQANFQVLVEPNGTTGSYILFDKLTLLPIATVNQAGQMIQISGGNVSITNGLLSPDVQKLITDVFTLKFTDNNTNTKLTTNFTDSITQDGNNLLIKTASGASATAIFTNTVNANGSGSGQGGGDKSVDRIPGPPQARSLDSHGNVTTSFKLTEHANATAGRADATGGAVGADTVSGQINFVDQNLGDRPTVSVKLADAPNFVYENASQQDVTGSLSALQKQDIAATQIQISVVPDPANSNNGSAIWTYTIPDHVFDFLGAGETLTLTYTFLVNNNFAVQPESFPITITITITGTNDKPVITTSVPTITFSGGTSVPGGPLTSDVPTSGTLAFTDVDLTDTHTVSVSKFSAVLPGGTVPKAISDFLAGALLVSIASGHDSTGTGTGSIDWSLKDIPVYLADFIPKGEVLTVTYTVTVKDSQGATSDQTVTVTITGTDAPAVVWIATNTEGSPAGGFWKDGANWETGNAPTINDDVIVITDQLHGLTPSYPVTIDLAAFGKSLTMDDYDTTRNHTVPEVINHSTLTLAGSLTLNADAKFTNAADGQVLVGGAIDVETITRKTGEVVVNTVTITNAGTLTLAAGGVIDTLTTIANSGTIELSGGTLALKTGIANTGNVKIDAAGKLTVNGATIDGGATPVFHGIPGGEGGEGDGTEGTDIGGLRSVGTVTNNGEFDLTGNAVLSNGILKNNGSVNVSGTGNALNYEVVTNAGTIEVLSGALTIGSGSTVENSSGNVIVDAALTLDGATISGGAIKGAGTIDVTSDSTIDGNATLTTGPVTVESDVTLTLDDATVAGTAITNHGTVKVDGSRKLTLKGASLTGGTLTVSGTLDSTGATTITNANISNSNLLESTLGGLLALVATTSTTAITNGGTLRANGAELDINGEAVTNTGTLAAINDGTLKLISNIVTNTDGTVSVEAGSTLDLQAATIDGGTVTIAGTLESTGASAIDNADITVASTGTVSVTSGTLTIDPTTSHAIANHGSIKAETGGTLKLTTATITNAGATISVDGTSKLYLTDVSINGGSLTNAGNLYSVGLNTVTGGVTNTGTIEVQSGTLSLSGGITGVGTLIIDDKATLALGGADAQTVTFAGGTNTLELDKVAGHSFTGTIAGQSSTGGTFTVTGNADITTSKGDALDVTASGGTSDNRANIVLTPTGALSGANNGIAVTQDGIGDISLMTVGDVTGTAGDGIVLHDGASGAGNITATIGGAASGAVGLDVVSHGGGAVTITNNGHITGTTSFGLHVDQDDSGATGSTHIINAGTVVGADGVAAISIQENTTGSATIDNSGTIGPDAASVTSTTYAIVETGGAITINNSGHINGNISVASATFDNNAGGTWTVAGSGVFGDASSIVNHGDIDLHGASISGTGLSITNDATIDSWGTASISGTITNTGTIEVHNGDLSLLGSLSGSGSVTVDAGATLEVEGAVSQTITLAGDGAHLQIDTSTFGGSIAALSKTDTIDLSTIKYGLGTSAVYVANADASTGGVLTVTDAYGHHISLTLTGADYSNTTFAGSDDGTGHTLITVHATDDAPAFTDGGVLAASVSEQANATGDFSTVDTATPATGSVDFTDIDLTDLPAAKITGQVVTSLGADHSTDLTASLTPGEIAALENALTLQQTGKNNGTVTWSYSIADGALDFLGQDQTAKVVSTITLDDGHGQKTTADVTITITGQNDAPTLAAVTTAPLVDTANADTFSDITGTLVGTDADHGETATLKYAVLDSHNNAVSTLAGHYGTLTVNANGTYDYSPDATAINALSAGSYVDTFTVQTTDTHGATGTATFTVNVTGANDTPVLSDGSLGKLTDTAAADTFSDLTGHLAGTDADTGDTLTYALLNSDHHATSTLTGHYGALTLNTDGSYTYVPDAASINALPQGSYSDAFTVQLTDSHGAATTATYTVDVTGADDAPVFNLDKISVTQLDDEQIVVHGLQVTDVDAAADETFTLLATGAKAGDVSPSSGSGSLADINTMLGTLTYNEGSEEPSTDTVALTVTDGHGATNTVNLIFNLAESADDHVSLTGTTGKDVFFGTGYQEQFVFGANSNHDTIVNFTPNQDHINLTAVVATDIDAAWIAQHVAASPANSADTLITIDSADTILLKGVNAANLHASDFIVHSG